MWNSFHTPIILTILGIAIRNYFPPAFSCPIHVYPLVIHSLNFFCVHSSLSDVHLLFCSALWTFQGFSNCLLKPGHVSFTGTNHLCGTPQRKHLAPSAPTTAPPRMLSFAQAAGQLQANSIVSLPFPGTPSRPDAPFCYQISHIPFKTTTLASLLQSNHCKTPSGIVLAPSNTAKRSTEKTLRLCQ